MAVAHVASATFNESGATTTGTITIPASVAAGHDLYVMTMDRGHTTLTCTDDDTGGNTWLLIGRESTENLNLFWKKATSSTASKTVTIAGSTDSITGGLSAFSGGWAAGNPTTNLVFESNVSGNEIHAGFTPVKAGSMICFGVGHFSVANAVTLMTCTDPGSLEPELWERTSTGGNDTYAIFAAALQSAGPTATGSFTWAQTNAATRSVVFAVRPEDGSGDLALGYAGVTESAAWTTTPDPFTFGHTPETTPRAALLYVHQIIDEGNDIDGMPTYGGTAFTHRWEIGGELQDDQARTYLFFLDDVDPGVQTVSIPHTATTSTKIANLVTVTGTAALFPSHVEGAAMDSIITVAGLAQAPIVTAGAAMRFMGITTSANAPTDLTMLSGMTAVSDHDFTNDSARVDRETTTSTSFTIGYTAADAAGAWIAVAISETEEQKPDLWRYNQNLSSVNHVHLLPTHEADDLFLLGFVGGNNGDTITTPTNWTRFDADGGNTTILPGFFWLEADGTETQVDIVTSAATNSTSTSLLWRIPAALRDITEDPEATIVGPTASGTPNPGTVTPSWGTATNYYFVILLRDANDGISSLGGNYTNEFRYNAQQGTATSEGATSFYETTSSSEDPPSSTVGSTDEEFKVATIAVLIEATITGTGASTLDGVTSSGSGTYTPAAITGTGGSTLQGVTSAGAGTYTPGAITGTGTSTLAGVSSAGTGTFTPPAATGTGASTLDGVTSSGSGTTVDPITGTGTSTLQGVTSTGTGVLSVLGSIGNVTCELVGPECTSVIIGPLAVCEVV